MRKIRYILILALLLCSAYGFSQIEMLKQQKLKKWNIPSGNYSGITPLGNNRYAVVSDKQPTDGFYEFLIEQNPETGKVENVQIIAFHGNERHYRDAEGITYLPNRNTVFIAAEDDQRILEYSMNGKPTFRELAIPSEFNLSNIINNKGFESLCYCDKTALFWTCTESFVKEDAGFALKSNGRDKIRLQSFDTNLRPKEQYVYTTDQPLIKDNARDIAFGVSDITALNDISLLILEREFLVKEGYIGSFVNNKIYNFTPGNTEKHLMAEWTTKLNLTRRDLANYEGMCLGVRLKDGKQTILLISDSQGGYGNSVFHLKDYIKVGICNFDIQ